MARPVCICLLVNLHSTNKSPKQEYPEYITPVSSINWLADHQTIISLNQPACSLFFSDLGKRVWLIGCNLPAEVLINNSMSIMMERSGRGEMIPLIVWEKWRPGHHLRLRADVHRFSAAMTIESMSEKTNNTHGHTHTHTSFHRSVQDQNFKTHNYTHIFL